MLRDIKVGDFVQFREVPGRYDTNYETFTELYPAQSQMDMFRVTSASNLTIRIVIPEVQYPAWHSDSLISWRDNFTLAVPSRGPYDLFVAGMKDYGA